MTGEEHGELRQIDAELAGLDQRRAALLGRRQALLAGLRASAQVAGQGAGQAGPGWGWSPAAAFGPAPKHGPVPGPWAAGRAETSSYTARNVLLVLGGVLLTVAAFAFTLLNWGSMGVGGRAAVLGGLTLGTLAVPLVLLRRELVATAEAVAGFGLALLALDAYALHAVWFPYLDGLGYTASSAALIAALWACYGLALPAPGLRLPLPFAVAVAQLPLPLWALTLDGTTEQRAFGLAVALLVTFAADVALAVTPRLDGRGARATVRAVRLTAAVAAVPTGVLMLGVTLSPDPDGLASAARWSAVQASAAAVLLLAGQRHQARRLALPLGAVAGLVLITALGGVVWAVTGDRGGAGWDWRVLVHLLCAMGLLGAVLALRAVRPARTRQSAGLATAAVAVQSGALAWTLVPVAQALFGPWLFATRAWEGAPRGPVRQVVDTQHAWTGSAATLLILLLLALSAALPVTLPPGVLGKLGRGGRTDRSGHGDPGDPGDPGDQQPRDEGALSSDGSVDDEDAVSDKGTVDDEGTVSADATARPSLPAPAVRAARAALPALCAGAGLTAPLALGLPYVQTVAVVAALAVLLLAAAANAAHAATGVSALVSGLTLAATATGWALAQQTATLGVLALLATASAAAAARPPKDSPGRRATCAAAAVAYAAGLAGAIAAALELPPHQASFAVLAVAVCTVPAAARIRGGDDAVAKASAAASASASASASRKGISLAVECTGYATAFVALLLCAPHLDVLWLAIAVCAASAAGVAVRADRRPAAGHASAALLVLATWIRLLASEVSTPEAYTLPVSVALLLVGALRRRRAGRGEAGAGTRVSSWWAYGSGLAFTFVPSLAMVLSDPHWLRPLLLGAGALATTLAGARWRMQAPLLLGGATLAAVGAHELAPYVAQVAGMLPRWLVPALAGLLLVAAGATYERRLEEARGLKRAWQRLG